MPELKFDKTKCAQCKAVSCLVKCRYMDFENRVTHRDPCFLGRYNNIYDEPRLILQSIPVIELVEIERNRKDAFCRGSGNSVTDLLAGSAHSPARGRAREAYETGADILAVACPSCLTMLTDAVKTENLDDKLVVKDISQILKEFLFVK